METLNCLCNQKYSNIEIIVVNDGSTDGTLAKAESVKDDRIKIIDSENGGAARARNTAYKYAKGEYVIFFDADDYIKEDFINVQWQKMDQRADVIVLSSWGRFYGDSRDSLKIVPIPSDEMSFEDWINHYWYSGRPMTTPGRALIPRKIIEKEGTWNEELSLNDDLEFFTRLFLGTEKLIFNPEAIYYYRSGVNGLSTKRTPSAYRSLYDSVALSTALALKHFNDDDSIKRSCANLWQSMVYEIYPFEKSMTKSAERIIEELGGSDLKYHAGGITKVLVEVVGWKLTKVIKTIRWIATRTNQTRFANAPM